MTDIHTIADNNVVMMLLIGDAVREIFDIVVSDCV